MLNFGSGLFYIGDTMEFLGTGTQELIAKNVELPDEMIDIRFDLSYKPEVKFECEIDPVLASKMFGGADLSLFGDAAGYTIEGEMPYLVQARRHKKKRINKKWLKRYGVKTMLKTVRMTEVHFNQCTNGFEGNIFY